MVGLNLKEITLITLNVVKIAVLKIVIIIVYRKGIDLLEVYY